MGIVNKIRDREKNISGHFGFSMGLITFQEIFIHTNPHY